MDKPTAAPFLPAWFRDAARRRHVAGLSLCCEETIAAYARGAPVRSSSAARIEGALAKLGYEPRPPMVLAPLPRSLEQAVRPASGSR